jgi:hypothetical protein
MILKKNIKIFLLYFIAVFILQNCTNNKQNASSTENNIADTALLLTNENSLEQGTVDWDNAFPDSENLDEIKILFCSSFHNDEVWKDADKENWIGLFVKGSKYYLQKTTINIEQVPDYITDTNDAWKVTANHKDSCLFLFTENTYLQEREIIKVELPCNKDSMWRGVYFNPNEKYSFNYSGIQYQFFATRETENYQNYRLYLKAKRNNKEISTLIAAQPNLSDSVIEILFAGDIDGDGLLDLIVDTSRHYNVYIPTLYLSKPAGEEQIVKPMGYHISVGC